MRKVMLLASMLAMVMLAASPALAQQGQLGASQYGDVSQEQCQNIIGDITVGQYNDAANTAGDDTATGGDQSGDNGDQAISQDEAQAIAQENNTTIDIVQQCATGAGMNVIGWSGGGTSTPPAGSAEAGAAAGSAEAGAAAGSAEAGASAGSAEAGAVSVLPDTGGASLFTLGAGALLVAGGLLARRIVR